jgi:N-dimethylarginine dimethylaminohydrolase
MTYSVYQHWDPLKVMAVGISYPPELYDYIKNEKVRKVFYKIAEETEEDYQKLITLLKSFNVEIVRPNISVAIECAYDNIKQNKSISKPTFMQPRDHTIMLGETFYSEPLSWANSIKKHVLNQGNKVENAFVTGIRGVQDKINHYSNGAMISRIGKDLVIGTFEDVTDTEEIKRIQARLSNILPNYRVHVANTGGHTDGTFCPVVPGLILSIEGSISYSGAFPDWEVIYLPNESWHKMHGWYHLKEKNRGKWWVPGEELNEDFTNYVEQWMDHWVGYVEESVFDVNMIVVDKKNVIVNGYNQKAFDAFSRHGITPHVCNFRHRYFWDGGLHCITSDLDREGVLTDWFPERNQ